MEFDLPLGLKGQVRRVVGPADTAAQVESGAMPVLATPTMITLMEIAAARAVAPLLPEACQTVGVHVNVAHLAATPVGMEVTAEAELIAIDGRTLTFRVQASDSRETVGEGTHQRFIIDVDRFLAKVEKKAAGKG